MSALGGTPALVVGASTVGLAFGSALFTVLRPRPAAPRLVRAAEPPVTRTRTRSAGELVGRAAGAAEAALDRRGRLAPLQGVLDEAGITVAAGQVVVLALAATFVAFAVGLTLFGPLAGLLLAAIAAIGFRQVVLTKRRRRRQAFADQLCDLIQLLTGSLRTGYGVLQAVENAVAEMESPTSDELQRVSNELRLGRDLSEALEDMARRVDSEDFTWVIQAIAINREVGGDLSEVLDGVAGTIRARSHLARQVSALSAEGRMSAYVLVGLPFAIAAVISVLNPGYLGPFFTTGVGLLMVAMSAVLITAGSLWLRRLIRPVY